MRGVLTGARGTVGRTPPCQGRRHLIPDRRTKIAHAMWYGQKERKGDRERREHETEAGGTRAQLRDMWGPQKLEEAGKALHQSSGGQ